METGNGGVDESLIAMLARPRSAGARMPGWALAAHQAEPADEVSQDDYATTVSPEKCCSNKAREKRRSEVLRIVPA